MTFGDQNPTTIRAVLAITKNAEIRFAPNAISMIPQLVFFRTNPFKKEDHFFNDSHITS